MVERECGPLAVALLPAASSVVGSATQLAIFDDTGCGASAMVFTLFSFSVLPILDRLPRSVRRDVR